jgi:hypothetical protein
VEHTTIAMPKTKQDEFTQMHGMHSFFGIHRDECYEFAPTLTPYGSCRKMCCKVSEKWNLEDWFL